MTKLSHTYPIALTFDQHPITVITDEHGSPWWIADEVCDALAIAMPHRALAGLDDDEKGRHTVTTPGGPQRKATINESGLYSLILRSRKPEAKRFKKWVTSEVLPSIRRNGAYVAPNATPPTLDPSALATAIASAMSASMAVVVTTIAARLESIERCLDERTVAPAPIPATQPDPKAHGTERLVEERRRTLSQKRRSGGIAKAAQLPKRESGRLLPIDVDSEGEPGERQRAEVIVPRLRQPFFRSDLARALWPDGAWNADRIDPIVKALESRGLIRSIPGRTTPGRSSARWMVTNGATSQT